VNHNRAHLHAISLAVILGLALLGHFSSFSLQAQDPAETPGAIHVSAPSCAHCPLPKFPNKAGKTESATVQLQITVTAEGRAANIEILKEPGNGFGEKAVEAVRKWKFKPARRPDGSPVAARVKIEVAFKRF
jgi:TonB family protein